MSEADIAYEDGVEKHKEDDKELSPGEDVFEEDDVHHADADPEEADGVSYC